MNRKSKVQEWGWLMSAPGSHGGADMVNKNTICVDMVQGLVLLFEHSGYSVDDTIRHLEYLRNDLIKFRSRNGNKWGY